MDVGISHFYPLKRFSSDLHSLLSAWYIPPPTYFCCFWILGWLVWKKEDYRSQKKQALPITSQVTLCKLLGHNCIVPAYCQYCSKAQTKMWKCSVQNKAWEMWGGGGAFYQGKYKFICIRYNSNILRCVDKIAYLRKRTNSSGKEEKWGDLT